MNAERQNARPAQSGGGHIPGEAGIWVFIGGDLLIFTLFFGTYLWYLGQEQALFAQSQATLNQGLGVLNTLVLLTSSWCVARVVHRQGGRRARAMLLLTLLLGAVFLVNKGMEWQHMVAQGHTLLTNNYFMFFFMFTGIHAVHVLLGMGALLYATIRLDGAAPRASDLLVIESAASFWHLVDLLWIVLFALLYLVR